MRNSKCLKQPDHQPLAMLQGRLEQPEVVKSFGSFEELTRQFTIEAPYVSRSQLGLSFDIFDGRRRVLAALDGQESSSAGASGQPDVAGGELSAQTGRASTKRRKLGPNSPLSWSRLFKNRCTNLNVACLARSETANFECYLSPSSSSCLNLNLDSQQPSKDDPTDQSAETLLLRMIEQQLEQISAKRRSNTTGSSHPMDIRKNLSSSTSRPPSIDEETDENQLRAEAMQLIKPMIRKLRSNSTFAAAVVSSQRSDSNHSQYLLAQEQMQQQQQQMSGFEVAPPECAPVSICLMDKSSRFVHLARQAENGRRWQQVQLLLAQLNHKLRCHLSNQLTTRSKPSKKERKKKKTSDDRDELDNYLLETAARLVSGRLQSLVDGSPKMNSPREKLNKEQLERLIGLTKNSLNHLIDAQLLLKNKLQAEVQSGSSAGPGNLLLATKGYEYEILLKNNFNLLKIWQNLEETRRLVCFVCEPIRATLSDLLWFSRQESIERGGGQFLLRSPLVSLDSVQVKTGLLQILEALHYLHAVCKLIHRNVNPRNVLICSGLNWKLSGLEFAIRFESTAISESASMLANEGVGMLLRFSSSSSQQSALRRQRTLVSIPSRAASAWDPKLTPEPQHQTRCDEISRVKSRDTPRLLQPELDYLAPEIYSSAKCSHKSDIFSFGLIVVQSYDSTGRHKAPIDCKGDTQNYDRQLKKLIDTRRDRLVQQCPSEMRAPLLAILEKEPNLRPSASYAIQLLRRPVELCKSNEDSMKHLRRALAHLDAMNHSLAAPLGGGGQCEPMQQCAAVAAQNGVGAPSGAGGGAGCGHNIATNSRRSSSNRKATSYFKHVTKACSQGRKQTRSLHLLDLLRRALDSLASSAAGLSSQAISQSSSTAGPTAGGLQIQQQQQQQSAPFSYLRSQFELSFESLRQIYESDEPMTGDKPLLALGESQLPSKFNWLAIVEAIWVALRKLLDLVAQMRADLPVVSRLTSAGQHPRPMLGPNHRTLAELDDRLHQFIGQHSLARLGPLLSDPLLKLDELINDLLAFVGLKHKQELASRGRQLLSELTPVTGCPSLSSSDEDSTEQTEEDHLSNVVLLSTGQHQHHHQQHPQYQQQQYQQSHPIVMANHRASAAAGQQHLTNSRETLANASSPVPRSGGHRYSDYDVTGQFDGSNQHQHQQRMPMARPGQHHQQPNQPPGYGASSQTTKISITAPSPMGSMRDMSRSSADSVTLSAQFATTSPHQTRTAGNSPRHSIASNTSLSNHHHRHSYAIDHQTLIDRTSEMSLVEQGNQAAQFNHCSYQNNTIEPASSEDGAHQQQPDDKERDKSRSQLIDELLKTINDDTFTDYNVATDQLNKQHRASTGSSGQRPKSAMDSTTSTSNSIMSQQAANMSPTGATHLTSSNRNNNPNTFDNVIRRMSTNFIQNFSSKIGSSQQQQPCDSSSQINHNMSINVTSETYNTALGAASSSGALVRREKSSTTTNQQTNSLYVDNQAPVRRHSDNTINIPRIQVAMSSPQAAGSRVNLNQRASVSASKLANKWKLTAKTNQREASDKLSPNLGGALGYMRRHSSGNTTGAGSNSNASGASPSGHDQSHSNGQTPYLLLNASPFKTRSSSNLGLDFLLSNRSMKRRYSAASMLGHQTQRKAEDLIDAGMKSVQNMFG